MLFIPNHRLQSSSEPNFSLTKYRVIIYFIPMYYTNIHFLYICLRWDSNPWPSRGGRHTSCTMQC